MPDTLPRLTADERKEIARQARRAWHEYIFSPAYNQRDEMAIYSTNIINTTEAFIHAKFEETKQ